MVLNQKIGYTTGVYGCSGEIFALTVINGEAIDQITYNGMYGHEYRVVEALKVAGYSEAYWNLPYGKLTRKDLIPKPKTEKEAVSWVSDWLLADKANKELI